MNHSIGFVERHEQWIHTNTIEGIWKHVKCWVNAHGGTREDFLAERLSEYTFFRDYLLPCHELKLWKFLNAFGECGMAAKNIIEAGARQRDEE